MIAAYILDSVPPKMQTTTTPFGDRLKREREMRGVTLEEIAVATRIAPRFLEALENEKWDQLPGGVFNRGFVRSVARFLGMDEDSLVGEYALATSAHDTSVSAKWDEGSRSMLRRRVAGVTLIVLLLGLAFGGWLAFYKYGHKLFGWLKSEPPAVQVQQPSATTPSRAAQNKSQQAPTSSPSVSPAASASGGAQSSAPVSPDSTHGLVLRVEAGKEAEITIAADGASVFSGKLEPGNAQTFQAQDRFQVSAKDSSSVLLELNGQTVPPLGAPGQPGTITLTRNDLRKPAQ
jgi:cytoskeleton protein RodZ